ncbi:uncharacterized protein LOC130505669 [Raphanus sativus]|uniref:Uncharacterized protein LOC130505669 n=1 Tax=Raphanus sativus TaxID=3726 RepID=A0A9W3CYG0_RAPSA|nr:uncharacterized protein LOC130505669 [Raphanus sativus]
MDYLFWRVLPKLEDDQFAWILWYIWKGRNNKVFSNLDIDPMDTLKLAETESKLWKEAQIIPTPKDKERFSGQGWYSTLEGFDGLMRAQNVRATLSPLHSDIEALLWAMECMKNLRQYRVTFATDYIETLKGSFHSSEIIYIPRTKNQKADSLAKSARQQPTFVVHMDAELPAWFTESS